MARTFGGTAADVVADIATGLPAAGAELTVWTAPSLSSTQVTAVLDTLGNPYEDGVVIADVAGAYKFKTGTNTYSVLYIHDPSGRWYQCVAAEVAQQTADMAAAFPALEADMGEMQSALGEITRSINTYITDPGEADGSLDANAALQAVVAASTAGGRIIGAPGSIYKIGGGSFIDVSGRHDLHFDFAGTTIRKVSGTGYATVFLDRFNGLGYGAGVRNLVIENAYVEGSFAEGSTGAVQLLGSNHGQGIIIRNCTFVACQIQGFHSFELDGCDGVLFEDCTWYGYKPTAGSAPRTESINIDCSQVGAGATVAPFGDGLPCRNISLVRCKFLPWTDPDTSITWPAPIPIGTHGSREGAIIENVYLDIYVEDPPVDDDGGSFTLDTDNPYHRGLVHIPSCRNVRGRIKVVCTDGNGSIRVAQLQGATTGVLASSDPNGTATSGSFTNPNTCEDVDLDLRVEGMRGSHGVDNPIAYVTGVTGLAARDIQIRISTDVDGANGGAYLRKIDSGSVDGDMPSTPDSVRLVSSPGVSFGPGMHRTIRKTADQTVNNSATLVNAAGLVLAVDADAVYRLVGQLRYNSGTAADIKFGWTAPSGAVMSWTTDGISNGATTVVSSVYRASYDLATAGPSGGNGSNDMLALPQGLLTTDASGSLTLQFAQETATVADTILRAGSWIRLERIA